MNKLLINTICAFIVKKKNRHKFREKYRKLSIFEALFLKELIKNNEMMKNQINNKTEIEKYKEELKNEIINAKNKILEGRYYTPTFPFSNFAESMNEYKTDRENLLKNLSPEAENRCKILIDKLEKIFYSAGTGLLRKDLFTKDELMEQSFAGMYMGKKEKKEDYYELDDYKLPINHFETSVFYYKHGIDTLKTKLDSDKAIIDVGCFIADSCCVFKRFYPNNKIYTFELSKENYELALKTIELNNLKDVVIENIGLGDKQENLEYAKGGSGTSILSKNENKSSNKCDTLDNYVKQHNIKVGMIKVDIEGFEQNFLQGAKQTISEQKPILLLSIYHTYNDFFKIKPIIESWNLGYKFDFFKGQDGNHWEVLLICEVL